MQTPLRASWQRCVTLAGSANWIWGTWPTGAAHPLHNHIKRGIPTRSQGPSQQYTKTQALCLCRVNSEVRASKKRADGHEERVTQKKVRIKAAERNAPELVKEELLPAVELPGTAQQLLEAAAQEAAADTDGDSDGALVLQRVLFPAAVRLHALPCMLACVHAWACGTVHGIPFHGTCKGVVLMKHWGLGVL